MATKDRKKLTKYEFAELISEVDGLCPLCTQELITLDGNRQAALSQAAHIYPHSPTASEKEILKDVPRLSSDDESIENMIMLCPNCHHKFDNPRSREGYMQLYALKQQLTKRTLARKYYQKHSIEDDLVIVLQCVGNVDTTTDERKLSYNAMSISKKMNVDASDIVKRMVTRDVRDYYLPIRDALIQLEHDAPGKSELIAKEVALFYAELKTKSLCQDDIYYGINDWLDAKTKRQYTLITPLITAFYIQNCEVFSQ